jgi:hypothetical protein
MVLFCVRGVPKARLRIKEFLSVMRESECVVDLREVGSRFHNDLYVNDQTSSHHHFSLMEDFLFAFCATGALEFFILVLAFQMGSLVSLHAKRSDILP